ncbi:MAG TPA: 3-hydroxyacyl-ACP dehydratase FabZ family protein [Planctomycetota bacterium]|nr:3-hydroxyacyl-ACP dehydratase FabZ family protein [Planctomycetota bacterium]
MDSVLEAIPHRAPFLFVDRVLERSVGTIVTEWDVRPDAPFFRGHYPGNPIVPGVLICESAFQAGAILCAPEAPSGAETTPVLARIERARFTRPVGPGETLRFEVELVDRAGPARRFSARASSAGKDVLRVEFTVALLTAGGAQGPGLGGGA